MVGIAPFSLRHVNDQVSFSVGTCIFFEFFDEDTIAFEVVNHIEGFLCIIVLVEAHWDNIVVREEFRTTILHTTDNFTSWSN